MITTTARRIPTALEAATQRVRNVDLRGPAGRLEAVLNEGLPDAPFSALACHPHPLGGGTLHNKVVYHAMKVLNGPAWGLGWPVLRFNFRGTGLSEGVHHGRDESADVLAALSWLENEYNLPVFVVGFSFGAAMALAACCGNASAATGAKVQAIAALGLPIRSGAIGSVTPHYDYSFLSACTIPKLFLSGDSDQFAPKSELIQVAAATAPPKQLALVPGADHFFHSHLKAMQTVLSGWLKEQV
jgi:hypothetical protein